MSCELLRLVGDCEIQANQGGNSSTINSYGWNEG